MTKKFRAGMVGAGNICEFHVAAAYYARQALNHVLHDGVQRGVWDATQVDWLARRILWENTAEAYGLDTSAFR